MTGPARQARLGFAAGIGTYALIQLAVQFTGGPSSSVLSPLVFLWAAVISSVLAPRPLIVNFLAVLVHYGTLYAFGVVELPWLIAHLGFIALFGGLFATTLRRVIDTISEDRDREVEETLARIDADARDFRLIGSARTTAGTPSRSAHDITAARNVGSVRAIREALLDVLEVARVSVDADEAMLFMLDEDAHVLNLKECVVKTGEPSVTTRSVRRTEGALGAVIKTCRSVNLKPRGGGRGLGYRSDREVRAFLGIPVMSAGQVSGVLAVHRVRDEDFDEQDEAILEAVQREAERAMESERIFAQMDRVKYEQERFFDAFSLLNEAIALEAIGERLLEAVERIKPLDFLALTLLDEEHHTVAAVRGAAAEQLRGEVFRQKDGGLVVTALKNGHMLPYVPLSQQTKRDKLQLFGPHIDTGMLRSVKVFPLVDRDVRLGALVLGSTTSGRDLSRAEERMIETVAVHATRALTNARMYERMELMATTDGLTGLVNHRRFRELLTDAIDRATRFARSVSVLMVDADHFKTINDTYGHPVGDLVLKRIAGLLEEEARRTDVVARYGGEEFVVILDETALEGAAQVAERIRARIEKEVIHGEFGRIRVTASLGVAGWPEHGQDGEALLEQADQALYEAKRKGRNRVEVYGRLHCAQPKEPAIEQGDGSVPSDHSRVHA